ncbi:putative F-box and WD40 domain protein [Sclerotinia borealis F-4128]|uniref:Putative F-box and WD40 domain protein n=1 Tax=Sclerotinia borealis (strain F-4128) TaxID=1432307 RepID=W9C8G7_SCLBF|nr:putative F-box and WD40 domain protein [Sclerotinia borealis F-4128]
MTRVFPKNECAPSQGARDTISDPYSDWNASSSAPAPSHSIRNTPGSVPFHPIWNLPEESTSDRSTPKPIPPPIRRMGLASVPIETDLSERMSDLSVGGIPEEPLDARRASGIRGLIRRASVSIKNRKRRHSHTTEERPSSSSSPWHRLRQATSFNRNSRLLSPHGDGPVDSCSELTSPIPGYGGAPPIIPTGTGGAARATAAAQNLFKNRQFLASEDTQQNDRESAIGIAMTTNIESMQALDASISRVDFVRVLPLELSIQVLAYLDYRSLLNVELVCRKWASTAGSQHVWREAFLRQKSRGYAMSGPVAPGAGLGVPTLNPDTDWKDVYRIKQILEKRWSRGMATTTYLMGHLDSIYCLQFDESKIITGSRDRTIRVWDLKTYTCTLVIGPPGVVNDSSTMTASDGTLQHHATGPNQKRYAQTKPPMVSFPVHHDASILCLQYDDEILVTGSSDSTCIVYDIKKGYKPMMRLRHHTAAVLDVAFDDRYIVTCSKDVTICIWDRRSGELIKQLRGHSGPVNAVQMRGNTIVSCSGDFRVKLWNIDTGKNIREFSGHTKGLACSQFSEDSKYIASAGNDKVIRIWDANTGECLKKIPAHDNLVRSLHIDSASGRLISGSYDQDIKVWDMESGRLLLDFPKWHASWVLGAKSDYRRLISTGQDPKILVMDFGQDIKGIEKLESITRGGRSGRGRNWEL